MLKATILLAALSALTSAIPCRRSTLTAAAIEQIDPDTSSCANAPAIAPGECRTADQAVPYIAQSFATYGVMTPGEQAALLALMLFESGGFKYNKNHYPGVPGQGTRNMQSPEFNEEYAKSLYPAAQVQAAKAQGDAAVLDLVNNDQDSFGSAAWFLTTQCSPTIRQGLAAGTQNGWAAYLTQCVGTADTAERDPLWNKAVAVIMGSN
ncbi:hypothetical protein K432DRAFT_377960 [Lepidopterella palustris CBS 459.81]|uniref:Uncharacterized protein n=1 Tax=Lepidopterella palustris CBS 459.81 TaxID=1314670 RepID=A0A8E2EJT4_9PEZI|nr:hypothetical protein K432DRAFT_377960 [Lepidopterella palustris CBS 459.81]